MQIHNTKLEITKRVQTTMDLPILNMQPYEYRRCRGLEERTHITLASSN